MPSSPIHIQFQNSQNPKAEFDIIRLEDLYLRKFKDHSPLELHRVEFFIILFVYAGHTRHTIDFTDYGCQAGSVLTIRKDQIHRFHRSQDAKGYLLLFTDAFVVSYLEEVEAQYSLQLFNELLGDPQLQLSKAESQEMQAAIQRMQEEYFEVNDGLTQGILRSQLQVLISKLFRAKANQKKQLRIRKYLPEFLELQQLVEARAMESTRVQDYAKWLGRSTKTLNNICRAIVNKSAKALIDDIALKQIKRLLINTDDSVKEIAYRAGFEEPSNFYKYFKRLSGWSPESFREKGR
ncbi:MAG: helix-turn-helix transcriptional regulator [Bacteroidota bacterium]